MRNSQVFKLNFVHLMDSRSISRSISERELYFKWLLWLGVRPLANAELTHELYRFGCVTIIHPYKYRQSRHHPRPLILSSGRGVSSLQGLVRREINHHLPSIKSVDKLKLPSMLKDYLKFEDGDYDVHDNAF